MTDSPNALNRRHFLESLSALGLGLTVMPEALTIAAQGSAVVTLEVLEAAQRIAGVSFTQAEQQAILSRLNGTSGYIAGSAFLRTASLGEDVQPAIVFNPVPPGTALPSGSRELFHRAPEIPRPSADEALAFLPVTHLAKLVHTPRHALRAHGVVSFPTGQIRSDSSLCRLSHTRTGARAGQGSRRGDRGRPVSRPTARHPVRLEGFVRRSRHDNHVRRVALEESDHRHRRNGLHQAQRGRRDIGGEAVHRRPRRGGQVVRWPDAKPVEHQSGRVRIICRSRRCHCRRAGWVCHWLRHGWVDHLAVRTKRTHRPAPDIRTGQPVGGMTLAWTQDTVGPMCRSAEDCALVFDAINGPDGKDNTVLDVPFGWDATADVRKLRVGYLRSAFAARPTETAAQVATRRNNEEALNVIRGIGVAVVPFDLPQAEIAALDFIRWAETAAAFDDPTRRGTLRDIEAGPEQSTRPADIRAGRFITAVDYIQANRYRMRLMEQMNAAMSGLDLFLGADASITNRLGYPILSVPSGFFEGSPTGLHMTGKLFGEPELLLLAHASQARTDYHSKHPALL